MRLLSGQLGLYTPPGGRSGLSWYGRGPAVNGDVERARINGEKMLGLHISTMMPEARRLYDKLGFSLIRELEPLFGQQYWLYSMGLSQ